MLRNQHNKTSLGQMRNCDFALPASRILHVVLVCIVMSGIVAIPPSTHATVLSSGDVHPSRDPFNPAASPGLPVGGNFIDPFEAPDEQTFYEGIHIPGITQANDNNMNPDEVIVGQTSFGLLEISGGSVLRFQDLWIGDTGELANGQTRFGTGLVRITGPGSTYNSDPAIVPPNVPQNFGSKTPRNDEVGFDMYVGRWGTGTLEISAGGRAEIQDAVIVGDQGTATGTILVDGLSSFLGSGGFESGAGTTMEINQMVIGRLGTGAMYISNGGQVAAYAPRGTGAGNRIEVAAVIGGNPYNFRGEESDPEAGGQGTVNVDGFASKWNVGGTLQVGAYHNITSGDTNQPELSGISADYSNGGIGRGTLNVSNDAVVNIISPFTTTGVSGSLQMLVGRLGRVNLAGGHIELSGGFDSPGNQSPNPLVDDIRLINDGLITGSGSINTGRFANRMLGEVRVGAGQALTFYANGDVGAGGELPMVNYGLIHAVGNETARAELTFDRANIGDPELKFYNARLSSEDLEEPPTNGGREVGLIHAQHATLRFRSHLRNQGLVSFTAGDNIVSGPVFNMPMVESEDGDLDEGVITVSGNGTTVVFEDDLFNEGTFNIAPNASLVTVLGDFTNLPSGAYSMSLGGGASGGDISFLSIGGDANLAGRLEVSLFPTGANPITPNSLMDGDLFQIISTGGLLSGFFTELAMPFLGPDTFMFPIYDYDVGTVSLLVREFTGDPLDFFTLDELLDLIRDNFGLTGATPFQGDLNGDGRIDGQDFLLWLELVAMNPGAASGAGINFPVTASVPEPTSLALLLMGGMLALARSRRR